MSGIDTWKSLYCAIAWIALTSHTPGCHGSESTPRRQTQWTPPPTPTNDHAVRTAVELGACLVACRIRSQEAYRERLSTMKPPAVEPLHAPSIFAIDGDCRQKCLTDYGDGLACTGCVHHIEARECVYGRDQRCRWSLEGHDLVLPCCLRDVVTDTEPKEGSAASACPASGVCP